MHHIDRTMILGDVVEQYPEAAQIMPEYGLHCVGCFANKFDTVEAGCKIHGMDDDEIDEMVDRVNNEIHAEH
jgi:hybrid cluster-associated redox disulfide protein